MSIKLSHRVQAVKPSPTLAITARAAQMRAAGKDIVGLGAGEPDFDTSEHIKAAAVEALAKGFTKYTAVDGIPSLKKAIIDKFKKDNGLDYQPKQILVSCGGKQSSYNLTQALLNPGDEVIIPAPFWVSYPDMVLLADGVPVIIETTQAQRFKITPEQLCVLAAARDRCCDRCIEQVNSFGRKLQHRTLVLLDLAKESPHRVAAVDADPPQQARGNAVQRRVPATQPIVDLRGHATALAATKIARSALP